VLFGLINTMYSNFKEEEEELEEELRKRKRKLRSA
jgi:hypothetical protein